MPIYEYQCQNCGHRLEKLQKMSDAPLVTCPACGEDALKKLVSAAAFRLKGSGWYETDFKKDGKKNLAGDDTGKKTTDSNKKSDGTSSDSASKESSTSASKPDSATNKPTSAASSTGS